MPVKRCSSVEAQTMAQGIQRCDDRGTVSKKVGEFVTRVMRYSGVKPTAKLCSTEASC